MRRQLIVARAARERQRSDQPLEDRARLGVGQLARGEQRVGHEHRRAESGRIVVGGGRWSEQVLLDVYQQRRPKPRLLTRGDGEAAREGAKERRRQPRSVSEALVEQRPLASECRGL